MDIFQALSGSAPSRVFKLLAVPQISSHLFRSKRSHFVRKCFPGISVLSDVGLACAYSANAAFGDRSCQVGSSVLCSEPASGAAVSIYISFRFLFPVCAARVEARGDPPAVAPGTPLSRPLPAWAREGS